MRMTVEHSIDSATAGDGFYGNTYRFEAQVEAPVENGMVRGAADFAGRLRDITGRYHGKDLAGVFEDPSCLNLAIAVAKELAAADSRFYSLRVWEGGHRWVEVSRRDAQEADTPEPARA